ncbi:MAG: hypothetical protein HKN54_06960 [Flavobacteriaceae bacterium]|nr:hypothetical protein [Flavobacteriaceae bacterium]
MEKDDSQIELLANGQWQTLIGPLTGLCAFEIIAYAKGKKHEGKYAVLHSIATNAYGSGKINTTKVNYGSLGNKLRLEWTRDKNAKQDYSLQIKTNSNYGSEGGIFVKIKELLNTQ